VAETLVKSDKPSAGPRKTSFTFSLRSRQACNQKTKRQVGSINTGSWYEINISSIVQGNRVYSLGVTSSSLNGADYSPKEAVSNNPELVKTYD